MLVMHRKWFRMASSKAGWMQRLGRLDPIGRQEPQQDLMKLLRHLTDKRMERHSTTPLLTSHYDELFKGLGTLTKSSKSQILELPLRSRIIYLLSPEKTASDIIQDFDLLYFHAKAEYKVAVAVLADSRIGPQETAHIAHAVSGGGTILPWTPVQRDFFRVHIANKLWKFGMREKCKSVLSDPTLSELVRTERLKVRSLKMLGRAWAAAAPESLLENARACAANGTWRAWYVLWTEAMRLKRTELASEIASLAPISEVKSGLQSAVHRHNLPMELDFVPRKDQAMSQVLAALKPHEIQLSLN